MSEKVVTVGDLEREARALVGTPFRHQGLDPRAGGVDCRGLVEYLAHVLFERPLPASYDYPRRPSHEALRAGLLAEMEEVPVEDAGPGDVVQMRPPREPRAIHVAVLVRGPYELMMVHAYEAGGPGRVVEEPYRAAWRRLTAYAYRFRGLSREVNR